MLISVAAEHQPAAALSDKRNQPAEKRRRLGDALHPEGQPRRREGKQLAARTERPHLPRHAPLLAEGNAALHPSARRRHLETTGNTVGEMIRIAGEFSGRCGWHPLSYFWSNRCGQAVTLHNMSPFSLMWSSPDVVGLFSNNVVSFSSNVVLRGPLFSLNVVWK